MTNWAGEFQKWAPEIITVAYKGNPTQRRNLQMQLRQGQFQVLLTTYEYIIKDRPFLSKLKWVHMIIGACTRPFLCVCQMTDARGQQTRVTA